MGLPEGLYGIADSAFGNPVDLGHALLEGGARVIQLRCKDWSLHRVQSTAMALHPACRAAGVPLILNDHPSLSHHGEGIHLGQEDGAFDRETLPPGTLVGRSTHDLEQLARAIDEGVDYVGFGPVFATRTKPNGLEPRGLAALRSMVEASPLPVVAIGGITQNSLAAIQDTGVHGWAVISAILAQSDPVAAARSFCHQPRMPA